MKSAEILQIVWVGKYESEGRGTVCSETEKRKNVIHLRHKLVRLGRSAAGRSGSHEFFELVSARHQRGINPDLEQELRRLGIDPGDSIISTAIPECLLHHSTTINIRELPQDCRKAGLVPPRGQEEAGKELPTFCKIVRFGPSGPKNRCLFSSRCDLQGVEIRIAGIHAGECMVKKLTFAVCLAICFDRYSTCLCPES